MSSAPTDTVPGTAVRASESSEGESGNGVRTVPHLTRKEGDARGRAERAEVPRSSHAAFEPSAQRRDPVELLEEQAQTRVPELVPLRYGRMLASPFTFFRGGAYLMAADLAGQPRTGLHVQLCGDAHLSHFGASAAPARRLVFSVNDFDETLPGPFEWDVKRLVASFAVAGRDRGFDLAQRAPCNLAAARAYREAMREFAQLRTLDLWYARIDVDEMAKRWSSEANAKQVKRFDRNVAKARSKDGQRAWSKLVRIDEDGRPRIISDPPLIVPVEELLGPDAGADLEETVRTVIRGYRRTLPND